MSQDFQPQPRKWPAGWPKPVFSCSTSEQKPVLLNTTGKGIIGEIIANANQILNGHRSADAVFPQVIDGKNFGVSEDVRIKYTLRVVESGALEFGATQVDAKTMTKTFGPQEIYTINPVSNKVEKSCQPRRRNCSSPTSPAPADPDWDKKTLLDMLKNWPQDYGICSNVLTMPRFNGTQRVEGKSAEQSLKPWHRLESFVGFNYNRYIDRPRPDLSTLDNVLKAATKLETLLRSRLSANQYKYFMQDLEKLRKEAK